MLKMHISKFFEKHRLIIFSIIVLLFLSFIIPSLKEPLTLDEVVFMDAARSVALYGKPYILNLNSWNDEHYTGTSTFSFHPPFYLDSLGLSLHFFKDSTIVARSVSAVFMILSAIILYLLSLKLYKSKKEKYVIASMAVSFFLLNPLTIKNGLLLDINGTALTFSVLLFSYFFLIYGELKGFKDTAIMGTLLALVMLSKLEGLVILIGSLFIYYWIKNGFLKSLFNSFKLSFTGIFIFIISWSIISKIQGLSFMGPFERTLNAGAGAVLLSDLKAKFFFTLWTIKNFSFWLIPSFFILFLLVILFAFLSYLKKEKNALHTFHSQELFILLIPLILLILATLHGGDAYGFPKYIIEAVPFMSLILSGFIIKENFFQIFKSKKVIFMSYFSAITVIIYNFYFLKDPFIPHNIFWTQHLSLSSDLNAYIIANLKGILFFIPTIVLFAFFIFLKLGWKKSLVTSCLILIPVNYLYINYVQSGANYSTIYAYGQSGYLDTIHYLEENTNSTQSLMARQDFCYYTKLKCYISYPIPADTFYNLLNSAIENQNLEYLVISPSENVNQDSDLAIKNNFILQKKYGNFLIYKKIGTSVI